MYTQIAQNQRRTWILLACMATLVIAGSVAFGAANGLDAGSSMVLGAFIALVYGTISYFASAKVALLVSGAKRIEKSEAPDLWNLVENLAISVGLPMPEVYIMEDASLNAFATGMSPEKSAIAVTTGLLQTLNKQELQGVIAHELSHVQNRDTQVMTLVVILIGVLSLFSNLFVHTRRSNDDRSSGPLVIIGILLVILSPIIAELIKLAISRQREYLADASGALMTRYPEGLAAALEKISRSDVPLKTANAATAHLFISNPFAGKSWRAWLSTHPPAEDRIARLRSMTL